MQIQIDREQLVYLSRIRLDPLGYVARYGEHIFRIVEISKREAVEKFLSSPFYYALEDERLITPVKINDNYILDEEHFLLESKLLPYTILPSQWTFSMLKEAVITVLKIFILCEKHGYNMIDGHPYNVLFNFSRPVWCDIGSFVKKKKHQESISGMYEFLRTMYRPLLLWHKGYDYLANMSLADSNINRLAFIEHSIPLKYTRRFFKLWRLIYNKLCTMARFDEKYHVPPDIWFYQFMLRKVSNYTSPKRETFWTDYQDEISRTKKSDRFAKIGDLLRKNCRDICSAIDLAGNQGELIKSLLAEGSIQWGVVLDYDIGAIDRLYRSIYGTDQKIFSVCGNMIDWKNKNERQKADLVLATAVTHHLLLTQKIPIDLIFSEINRYAKKYVLIEFMPLGLWDGHTAPPVPDWYSETWFDREFRSFFEFIVREQLGPNRIVYMGRIK